MSPSGSFYGGVGARGAPSASAGAAFLRASSPRRAGDGPALARSFSSDALARPASPTPGGSGAGSALPPAHSSHVNAVQFDSLGVRLVTADGEGRIVLWDASADPERVALYKPSAVLDLPMLRGIAVVSAVFHPHRDQLLVLAHHSFLRLFDVGPRQRSLHPVRAFAGLRCAGSKISAGFSPDGRYVFAGSESGECCIWETDSGVMIEGPARVRAGRSAVVMGFGGTLSGMDWHPTEHLVALSAAGDAHPILLFDALNPLSSAGSGLRGR